MREWVRQVKRRGDIDYSTSSTFSSVRYRRPYGSGRPATDKQVAFLRTLVDKAMAEGVWPRGLFWGGGHDLTASDASRAIDRFRNVLRRHAENVYE